MPQTLLIPFYKALRGFSIIAIHLGGGWVYTFFVMPLSGKLGGWVVLYSRPRRHGKQNNNKVFCIIKEMKAGVI